MRINHRAKFQMTKQVLQVAIGVAVAELSSSCLFYDSRWGQETQSQQRVAQQRTPNALEPSRSGRSQLETPVRVDVLRVRVHDGTTNVGGAAEQFLNQVVDNANQLLAKDLGVSLEVSELQAWKQESASAPLAEQLTELKSVDGGEGADLVMGLSSPIELLTFSFHQLGVAEPLGKHLVLRAASDARELEAIEKSFPDLDANERHELYSSRKLHKATALLLHELGHALGAVHTMQREELMYPSYSTDMKSFSAPSLELLRVSLEQRREGMEHTVGEGSAQRMLQILRSAPQGTWNQEAWQAHVSVLERLTMAKPREPQAEQGPAGLSPADRATYREAARLLEDKQVRQAWERARSLFGAYPEEYAVQDLRCKIAMQLNLSWDNAREECLPLMRLSGMSGGTGAAPSRTGAPRE